MKQLKQRKPILLQLSLASPLKKISTKPTQHDEAVETEKTDSASTLTLASPLKKISTKPTQHDEAVETEKTDSASTSSTSLASPLKKINTDEKKIITPSKIICCKDDTSTSSDSASTSLASPLKKIVLNRPNTMKQLKQKSRVMKLPKKPAMIKTFLT